MRDNDGILDDDGRAASVRTRPQRPTPPARPLYDSPATARPTVPPAFTRVSRYRARRVRLSCDRYRSTAAAAATDAKPPVRIDTMPHRRLAVLAAIVSCEYRARRRPFRYGRTRDLGHGVRFRVSVAEKDVFRNAAPRQRLFDTESKRDRERTIIIGGRGRNVRVSEKER